MNKTKTIVTVGPSSKDKDTLRSLITTGADVVRINLAYADYNFCRDIKEKLDDLNRELHTEVALLLDVKGPDIRIGNLLEGKADLRKNDKIRIYMDDILGDQTKFSISYPDLIDQIKCHTILKINDGNLSLEVLEKGLDYLLCLVLNDGTIQNQNELNVPGLKLNRKFVSDKDHQDILFANEIKVDYLALSFVSSAEDILEVNDLLIELENDHMGIIAKVENESAMEEIDDIIRVSEGVMIARGDLGVEIPMERIPSIQKSIIRKCHTAGKISIVATEMMSSMEKSEHPTRAEVSDVANAVMDGVDAVMLTGETTIGHYPIETLEMMEKIIKSAEENIDYINLLDLAMRSEKQDITGSIAYSVTECANRLKCKAVVTPSKSGYTARKMSRFRPSCPIIALSPDHNTVKSLSLYFGVHAILVDELNSFDKIVATARQNALTSLPLVEGDKIIVTGGYPFQEVKHTNFMKIEEL